MKKFKTLLFASSLLLTALTAQLAAVLPAVAQTDQAQVKCGNNQVAIGVAINGSNCLDEGTTVQDNVIVVWLTSIIKFLTVGVGLAATGGVVYGGFLYLTAQGKPAQVKQGIAVIINALIGIVLYALAFAIINFLVPGGVLQ